jgi:hypothetical protein
MNIGGAATTITMLFAGLAGSGILGVVVGGSDSLQENTVTMDQFIAPIATFTGVLSIGLVSGGLAYVMTYLRSFPYSTTGTWETKNSNLNEKLRNLSCDILFIGGGGAASQFQHKPPRPNSLSEQPNIQQNWILGLVT